MGPSRLVSVACLTKGNKTAVWTERCIQRLIPKTDREKLDHEAALCSIQLGLACDGRVAAVQAPERERRGTEHTRTIYSGLRIQTIRRGCYEDLAISKLQYSYGIVLSAFKKGSNSSGE